MTEAAPRLFNGLNAEYAPAQWGGRNTSGIRLVGNHVLVLMDQCSTVTSGSAGAALLAEAGMAAVNNSGITMNADVIERMSMAAESGVLVGLSGGAFLLYEDGTRWTDEKPKPGDRVYVEKYAGTRVRGIDGREYRLMASANVKGIYEIVETEETQGKKEKSNGIG